jgi:hypothetical protein
MTFKETQVLTIDQDNQAETWEVIISDPSDGAYRLVFQDPITLEYVPTEEVMYANDSASTFANRIRYPYYNSISSTTVTKTTYDIDGTETSVAEDIKTAKYTV